VGEKGRVIIRVYPGAGKKPHRISLTVTEMPNVPVGGSRELVLVPVKESSPREGGAK